MQYIEKLDYLDEYLDEFIDKASIYSKVDNDNPFDNEYMQIIHLSEILKRDCLKEEEYEYVFDYLKQKGITVTGTAYALCGYFDNYKYFQSHSIKRISDEDIDYSKLDEEFMKYQQTNDEKEKKAIRENLIINNMSLVFSLASKYYKINGVDFDDILGYGYEGLIYSIDNYIPNNGYKFSSYASTCIIGYILKGIPKLLGFEDRNFYYKILKARDELYGQLEVTSENYMEALDKILHYLCSDETTVEERKRQLNMCNYIPLDSVELADRDDLIQDTIDELFHEQCREEIMQMIDRYDPYGVIVKMFGLDSEESKTGTKIGEETNYSRQNISLIKKKALARMSHSRIFKEMYRESIS